VLAGRAGRWLENELAHEGVFLASEIAGALAISPADFFSAQTKSPRKNVKRFELLA